MCNLKVSWGKMALQGRTAGGLFHPDLLQTLPDGIHFLLLTLKQHPSLRISPLPKLLEVSPHLWKFPLVSLSLSLPSTLLGKVLTGGHCLLLP